MPDDMTLGEVGRTLAAVQKTLSDTVVTLDKGYVKREYYTEQVNGIKLRLEQVAVQVQSYGDLKLELGLLKLKQESSQAEIDDMNESRKWLVRLVVGSVLGAVISILVAILRIVPQ